MKNLNENYRLATARVLEKLADSRETDDDHPYLLDHDVPNYDLSLDRHGNLLGVVVDLKASFARGAYIPKAQNLLTISRGGSLSLEPEAKLSGAALLIGHRHFRHMAKAPLEPHTIILVKDYAAGAVLHRDSGWPVVVFLDFNNLGGVARICKRKFPKSRLIIFAGERSRNDVARQKIWDAAKAVGAAIMPYQCEAEANLDALTLSDMGFIPEPVRCEALGVNL